MATSAQDALTGLALPAVRTHGSRLSARRGVDAAWGDVIIAMMCPIGGRPMRRTWGNPGADLIFDMADSSLLAEISAQYREAIGRLCPHVSVREVVASLVRTPGTQADARTVNILVAFSLVTDRTTVVEREVQVDRSAVLQSLGAMRAR